MTTRWRPFATTVVCLLGLGLAGFLTWGHYFDQHAISHSCPLSQTSSIINCGAVTTSPQSVIFGIPVALYGLMFFVVMLAICLPVAWRSPSLWLARARVALNVVGMGFVLYLIGVEFLELHYICIYCTGVHILQFALFLLVITGWYDTGYAQRQYLAEP
ncbi:MAG: vitamin K epoxide reductase family protein [Acidimicrobiales bacterium]